MVELYRKGDYKNPDRRKITRPEDRRIHPRFVFFADCVLNDSSELHKTRVTETSMGGCFVEMAGPIAQNTDVTISITKDEQTSEARGRLLYAVASVGSGIVFVRLSQANGQILENWISGLSRSIVTLFERARRRSVGASARSVYSRADHPARQRNAQCITRFESLS
jgi:PilZ domain-containing protein